MQTLFYGVFSAWVLWARQTPPPTDRFNWHEAVWHLRAPVLRALFQQLSDPGQLRPLGLVEVLDWTAAALDRVDQAEFFARFNEGEAVPYFYEPFLQAFDPALRKQLGVWYTPAEVVRYMVARVDRALRDDLGIADGLAAENVYVLDPCCGTGAYLAEVLRRIAANLQDRGLGALTGARVKQAAMERVFGFEIMPAPFVVAHLQVGLTMQDLDAPLAEDGDERAGVFLTNALTGWEPTVQKPLPFRELEEERDRAERVKRETPILVIVGNPPYNGFAGMAVEEERELSVAYRTTKRVREPEGQGLNDLYVRFFRMAERRIAEKTRRGVVCFISNYSWLDGLSFTGMRERYLEAFDAIRIDNLNGDKYKTGKTTPTGDPDPSIFSTPEDPVGIQVGTAITTLVRRADHSPTKAVGFRHLWGQTKREGLTETAEAELDTLYDSFEPLLLLGLPFAAVAVSDGWSDWPSLPELFPTSFPGVKTSRDAFLIDTDLDRLEARVADYFNPDLSHDEIGRRYPGVMKSTARFDARVVRGALLARGGPTESGFIRHAYRPFDNRWLYWEAEPKLLDEKRADYKPHVFEGNLWLGSNKREIDEDFSHGTAIHHLGNWKLGNWGIHFFPAWLRDDALGTTEPAHNTVPNLSPTAQRYLDRLGMGVEDLFHHVLAMLHDPAYRHANAGALRMEWPRIPLPGWPELSALVPSGRGASRSAQFPGGEGGSRTAPCMLQDPRIVRGKHRAGTDRPPLGPKRPFCSVVVPARGAGPEPVPLPGPPERARILQGGAGGRRCMGGYPNAPVPVSWSGCRPRSLGHRGAPDAGRLARPQHAHGPRHRSPPCAGAPARQDRAGGQRRLRAGGGRRAHRGRAAGGGGQSAAGARLRPQPQHLGQDRPPRRLGAGPLRRRGPAAAASAPRCRHPPPARLGHPAPPAPRHPRGGAAAAPPSPASAPGRLRRPPGLAHAAPGRPRRAARRRHPGRAAPARPCRLAAEHSRHRPRRLPHLARRAARAGHALPPPGRRPRGRRPLQSRQRHLARAPQRLGWPRLGPRRALYGRPRRESRQPQPARLLPAPRRGRQAQARRPHRLHAQAPRPLQCPLQAADHLARPHRSAHVTLDPQHRCYSRPAEHAAQTLAASAARGRELTQLLDCETPVPGVTEGALRPEMAAIAVPSTSDGRNLSGDDFALTAGWGHFGSGQTVMPGQGRIVERAYTRSEREALGTAVPVMSEEGDFGTPPGHSQEREPFKGPVGAGLKPAPTPSIQGAPWDHAGTRAVGDGFRVKPGMTEEGAGLGETTFDVYLNDRAYWRNVPAAVWNYKLGGYQVLKKWLSYRERNILGRPLLPEEVEHFTDTARRIAAVLLRKYTT